jgi:hypothetical protein
MERHEVPTVFVHGHVEPLDVGYVEERLCAALLEAPAVRYSVLWIDTVAGPIVEIEAGVIAGPIGARARGATVRIAGDMCIGMLRERLAPVGRVS